MSLINTYFDRVFIINLDSRKDRWHQVVNELERLGIDNYERFSAIRPETLQDIPASYYKYMATHISRNTKAYIIGSTGCKMSHVEIVRIARPRCYARILILEDDALFVESADAVYRRATRQIAPEEWDMLYLCGNHLDPVKSHTENLDKITATLTAHAYGISMKLFNCISNDALNSGLEIDTFYAREVHNKYRCFCTNPHIITQRPGYSDILLTKTNYKLV